MELINLTLNTNSKIAKIEIIPLQLHILENCHPYKIQTEDGVLRNNNGYMQCLPLILNNEATFTLIGTVNRQNCTYWELENPNWLGEHHTQYPQKCFATIRENIIIERLYFQGN